LTAPNMPVLALRRLSLGRWRALPQRDL